MSYTTDIKNCIAALRAGETILYPTDTIRGIGCDATNAAAVARVYALKKRAEEKSMIILLADEHDIGKYATAPPEEIRTLIRKERKPLTVIYPGAKNLAENLPAEEGSIAIRIVKDDFCIALIRAFGRPLVSTSANISGEPFPENYSSVSAEIKKGVGYIVQHRQDDESPSSPSRILKWTGDKGLIVIRD